MKAGAERRNASGDLSSEGDGMAEEIDAGVAYLKALKQPANALTAAAAAPAPESMADGQSESSGAAAKPAEGFKGAEKRRSPRYKCEGGAEIREEGCDAHTWATFTDISLHDC